MSEVCLGLGSNLGDKRASILRALDLLAEAGRLIETSSLYKTEPVGYKDQDWFLNCAVKLETRQSPRQLLDLLQSIEGRLGRKERIKNGPRTIDLDILFYDNLVARESGLVIPHPRMHERLFVLAPLREIAPELVHPVLNKTVRELADSLHPREAVQWYEPRPNLADSQQET
jgi:2-amino-4-hydroxy-6-hydroxymethyldihydropteridine diphosphokinase